MDIKDLLHLGEIFSGACLSEVDDNEKGKDAEEHDCNHRTELRGETALACVGIDIGRERVQTYGSACEEGHSEVVKSPCFTDRPW